jgi:hypothetical protein
VVDTEGLHRVCPGKSFAIFHFCRSPNDLMLAMKQDPTRKRGVPKARWSRGECVRYMCSLGFLNSRPNNRGMVGSKRRVRMVGMAVCSDEESNAAKKMRDSGNEGGALRGGGGSPKMAGIIRVRVRVRPNTEGEGEGTRPHFRL